MARMHSKKRGKSGSTKPYLTEPQEWIPIESKEIIELVIKYYKQGSSQSEIGIILRDKYAVPSIKLVTGKSVLDILKENELAPSTPEDLLSLIRRAMTLRNHLVENKKDLSSTHGLKRIESKIYRLSKYYRNSGVLPKDWRYRPENASILLR